jgi:hypothetical protein
MPHTFTCEALTPKSGRLRSRLGIAVARTLATSVRSALRSIIVTPGSHGSSSVTRLAKESLSDTRETLCAVSLNQTVESAGPRLYRPSNGCSGNNSIRRMSKKKIRILITLRILQDLESTAPPSSILSLFKFQLLSAPFEGRNVHRMKNGSFNP